MACWIRKMKWYFDRIRRERCEDGSATPPPPPPPAGGIFPVITSNGGNSTAAISAAEGQTAVTTVTATGTAPLTFDIAGGADAAKFNIGSTTGVLTFIAAPVYASPTDVGTDNIYDVIARVTNSTGQTALQTIAVTVIEVVAGTGPTIISNGAGPTASVSIADGASAITTVQASGTLPIAYSKGGSESSLFSIDTVTGVLALTSSSAYVDGGDNTRDVTVIATNPFGVDSQAITVTIQAPPVVSGDSPTMPLATIIDRMRTNLDFRMMDGNYPPNRYPGIRMPMNYAFWRLAYDPYGAEHPYKFDSFATWFWVYPAQYNTATGKRLEVRRLRGGLLLDSPTGPWWDSGVRSFQRPGSAGQAWDGNYQYPFVYDAVGEPTFNSRVRNQTTESISIGNISGNQGVELWSSGFYLNFGRSLGARAQANVWICECRVINEDGTPYTGADAKFLVNLGYDPYNSQRDTPYNATFTSSIYPNAADGGSPTWIVVDGSMGWTSVGGIGVTGSDRSFVNGPPYPFGDFTGGPGSWLGDDSPYVPTPAQLAINPPTFITTAATAAPNPHYTFPLGFVTSLGGVGGTVVKVTNLSTSGAGSLKAAIDTVGTRIVVFETSGVLDMGGATWTITQPDMWIAGQTAPSPGFSIIKGSIDIKCAKVIIQHLRVRTGSDAGSNKDAIQCLDDAVDCIIDHCSMSWGTDEIMSAGGYPFDGSTVEDFRANSAHRITFSNNIIAEPLTDEAGYGTLIEDNCRDILMWGNFWAHCPERSPNMSGGTSAVAINNYTYNPGGKFYDYTFLDSKWDAEGGGLRVVGSFTAIGNVCEAGPNTSAYAFMTAVSNRNVDFYSLDNICIRTDNTSYPLTFNSTYLSPQGIVNVVGSPPITAPGVTPMASGIVKATVLANVGARPWDRDTHDNRVINHALTRTGGHIADQSAVGGYPASVVNTLTFNPAAWDMTTMTPR